MAGFRATIKDVSALAKVSTKTVSRVLNKERYVSPETLLRVERAGTQRYAGHAGRLDVVVVMMLVVVVVVVIMIMIVVVMVMIMVVTIVVMMLVLGLSAWLGVHVITPLALMLIPAGGLMSV